MSFITIEVTVGETTYYIPDPDYNVWPGPEAVTIEWKDGDTLVCTQDYEAASEILQSETNAYILDVRTPEEWFWVGHPGINKLGEGEYLEGKVINIAYKLFVYDKKEDKYTCVLNDFFDTDVAKVFNDLGGSDPLIITMCRSGHRSVAAENDLEIPSSVKAARRLENLGMRVYNTLTGFEGGKDAAGYRTLEQGWENLGLPYNYSAEGAYWRPGIN